MKCPQRRGVCLKVHIITPRKPCSARRAIARVKLSNKKMVTCHIPGEGHNIKKYSSVLVRGGKPNDLPGVTYKVIHGAKKTDLQAIFRRKTARSKFGVKNTNRTYKIRKLRIKTKK
jgi:small subunit ribosomal protein S12